MKLIIALLLLSLSGMLHAALPLMKALESSALKETVFFGDQIPANKSSPNLDSLNKIIHEKIEQIKKSRLIYSWEVASPRDRVANYCIDQCACLNREILPLLKMSYKTFTLVMRPKRESYALNVTIRNARGELARYDYHVVTIVKVDQSWFVIDPVVTQNPYPEAISDWFLRLDHPETLAGYLY